MFTYLLAVLLTISMPQRIPSGVGAWSAIKLPEMPLGLTAHQGELWVVGANEMIADSGDGGRTWKLRHRNRKGEMLFSLSFATDEVAYAMGSGGIRLESRDGGDIWRTDKRSAAIRRIEFADSENGFGLAHNMLVATRDGGASWHGANLQEGPAKAWMAADRSSGGQGWSLAVLDAKHALAAYGTRLAFTQDGGTQWKLAQLPGGTELDGLRVADGKYVLDSSDPGESRLYQFTSGDGSTWTVAAAPPATSFTNCAGTLCLTGDGWADFSSGSPEYYQLPKADYLRVAWAASGAVYCEVGSQLWCATGEPEAAPGATREAAPATAELTGPSEISAPEPSYSDTARKWREQGDATVLIRIDAQGRVQEAQLVEASYSALGLMALGAVQHWKFEPARKAGVAVAVNAKVGFAFSLYP